MAGDGDSNNDKHVDGNVKRKQKMLTAKDVMRIGRRRRREQEKENKDVWKAICRNHHYWRYNLYSQYHNHHYYQQHYFHYNSYQKHNYQTRFYKIINDNNGDDAQYDDHGENYETIVIEELRHIKDQQETMSFNPV